MSDNKETLTIKLDKKLIMLFVVIFLAVATGLFFYNNVMKPNDRGLDASSSYTQASAEQYLKTVLPKGVDMEIRLTPISYSEYQQLGGNMLNHPDFSAENVKVHFPISFFFKFELIRGSGELAGSGVAGAWKEIDKEGWQGAD